MPPEHQQILVASYQCVGLGGECGGQNRVNIRPGPIRG
jgi:hypothetical protein